MSRITRASFACLAIGAALPLPAARAGTMTIVYAATGSQDGVGPRAGLTELNGEFYGTTSTGGTNNEGTVFKLDPATGAETQLYSVVSQAPVVFSAALTSLNGTLYGTESSGGPSNGGILYSIDPTTGAETLLQAFDYSGPVQAPVGPLTVVGNLLYGTASSAASSPEGVVYSFDPADRTLALVASIPNSGESLVGGLLQVGQYLYGVAGRGNKYGSVFQVSLANGKVKTVATFDGVDGNYPDTPLIAIGSKLYGGTQTGGTGYGNIYELDLASGTVRSVYAFPAFHRDTVVLTTLLASNGLLYGTRSAGGAQNDGFVFKLDPATGTSTTLHEFTGGADGSVPYGVLTLSGDVLYGTTASGNRSTNTGGVFSIPLSGGPLTVVHAFQGPAPNTSYLIPNNGLLAYHGSLYATFEFSGTSSAGEVVRIDLGNDAADILYSFNGFADGGYPTGSLVSHGGHLFGTAYAGGAHELGLAYRLEPGTGQITTLHDFSGGKDGANPAAALVWAGTDLYGTTNAGGASGLGTVFKLAPGGGAETVLHAFDGGADGSPPLSSMVDIAGTLYGLTTKSDNTGTIFSLDTATGIEAKATDLPYDFSGQIYGGLSSVGGLIYATAPYGGSMNTGTVFSFDTAGGGLKDVYDFPGVQSLHGSGPDSNLVRLGKKLYGLTEVGGTDGCGTIYSVNPATGMEKVEYSFTNDGAVGCNPEGALISVGNALYGTTSRGYTVAGRLGVAFKFVP